MNMKKLLFSLGVAALAMAGCCDKYDKGPTMVANSTDALVQTAYGTVSGYIEDGIYTFKGIPYAKAERFMAPTEPDAWEGVRSCLYYGPQSPQAVRTGWQSDKQAFMFHWDDGTQSEDCQVLNVWTPGINDGKKRPVMVWLHGGGYTMGAGSELPFYDGANLAKKDVVLVNLNHRLNVVGYLDLSAFGEKYKYSGVAGVMDMIMALKWVKQNIAGFGGDPDNVMIFGQSGGGGKVNILLAAPSAKGLFNKAAVQSGSIMTVTEPEVSRLVGIETAKALGLNEKNIDEIQKVPYADLLEASNKAAAALRGTGRQTGMMGVSPVRDGEILPYQLGDPEVAQISGDIPVIVGHNYSEGTSRAGACAELDVRYNWGGAPEYLYIFAKDSPLLDGAMHSMHNMEISFVFNNIYLGRHMTGTEPAAYRLADLMSDVWVSFAKDGVPDLKKLKWEPYNPDTKPTMIFDVKTRVVYDDDPVIKQMAEQQPFRWNF